MIFVKDIILLFSVDAKVHIFWEGHKILQNLHQLFDWQYIFVLNAHENIKNPPQKLGNNSQLKLFPLLS